MSVAHAAPADHEMVLAAELFVISSGSGPKVRWEVDQGPELGFYATGVSELSCSCLAATWSWRST